MTRANFNNQMMAYVLGAGKILCERTIHPEDDKIEQEQVRKNLATILMLLTTIDEVLENQENNCSSSVI